MELFGLFLLLIWVVGAILCGVVAGARNRSGPGWGALALLVSPLLVVLVLIAMPVVPAASAGPSVPSDDPSAGGLRGYGPGRCVACGVPVAEDAKACPACAPSSLRKA
jgi:hypothetical protein